MLRRFDHNEEHSELIVKLARFVDESELPQRSRSSSDFLFNGTFSLGAKIIRKPQDYASISLNISWLFDPVYQTDCDLLCVISVLDASVEKRFPTSHVFRIDTFPTYGWTHMVYHGSHIDWDNIFVQASVVSDVFSVDSDRSHTSYRTNVVSDIDRYDFDMFKRTSLMRGCLDLPRILECETLLSEPDDLLPDDCLTLHIDVVLSMWSCKPHCSCCFNAVINEEILPFWMDMETWQRLGHGSLIPREDFFYFQDVCLLLGGETIQFLSGADLRRIYMLADEYDIPVVVDICRGLISTLLRAAEDDPTMEERLAEGIPQLLELAEARNDVRLKEIVVCFVERNREDEAKEGSETTERTRDDPETEWRLERVGTDNGILRFTRGTPEAVKQEEFHFYQ